MVKRKIKAIKEEVKEVKQEVKAPIATTPTKINAKLPDHIDEYFTKIEGSSQAFHSRELFKADPLDVDIKTDIDELQVIDLNKLAWNDHFLKSRKLKPVFQVCIDGFMRKRISLDRKSRGEFVSVNRQDNMEQSSGLLSNLANITNIKK